MINVELPVVRQDAPTTREERRRFLQSLSPIRLAVVVVERGLILEEDSDAIEVILDAEFAPANNHHG